MNYTQYALCGIALVSLASLEAQYTESVPLRQAESVEGPLFTKIPSHVSGLDAVNTYDDPEMWNSRYQEFKGGAVGTGVSVGDVDGDGWLDLYVVNKTGPNRLYRQVSPLRFEDITDKAGVPGGAEWGSGASFADVDNDGDLDLYTCHINGPNLLYLNNGQGQFTEAGKSAGVDIVAGSVMGAFEDYDRDGDLDLFLLTNLGDAGKSPRGDVDYLLQNDGKGRFKDVTVQSGILSLKEKGHSATWWDANGDGWSDLYIANDFEEPDHLYRNNGDGTFTDILDEAIPHTAWFSMGSDFTDVNNDGLLDFLVGDMASTTHFKQKVAMGDMGGLVDDMDRLITPQYMVNAFYVNSGTTRFMEGARLLGVANTDWTWSVRFEDLDGDGWQDLHVTNGMVRSFNDSDLNNQIKRIRSRAQVIAMLKNSPPLTERNLAFRNTGNLDFENWSDNWGLAHEGVSFGSALADLDNDGDIDIVYTNYEDEVSLYRNNGDANSIVLSLQGQESNRNGIGARIVLESRKGSQTRQVSLSRGVLSSSVAPVHFGLGEETEARQLTVFWPSGRTQVVENLRAGQHYKITEKGTKAKARKRNAPLTAPLFSNASKSTGLDFTNTELPFNDMIRQSLLPNRMNTLGGGVAFGDADSDGDADIYFAGAKGQHGQLYWNEGQGRYSKDTATQPWQNQRKENVEEMAPLWVDINGDGLLDLYVTSGSVEDDAGSPNYADSLYLNKGGGTFVEAECEGLKSSYASASVAASADFDRDGDMDVFVGGRVIPGQYPESPQSFLLENVDGDLVSTTSKIEGIENLGMVTSALWSDANGDGWLDLVVSGEWEPIRFFLNEQGKLAEKPSQDCGLEGVSGWWNSLTAADVDNDGDIDYIAGNVGLNTKYHASKEAPIQLFYGDFEGRGTMNIVEAEYEGDALFPMRGKSCSTRAMPSLGAKFDTFRSFASALLTDIYDVSKADRYEANELQHGVFINDGNAAFEFQPLPRLAQIAPVWGLVASDLNGDGNVDIALGQNFHGPQVETGRFDGGLGLLLLGDGSGGFEAVGPLESGILIPGEARGLAMGDWNEDGRPDLLFTRVNESALPLVNHKTPESRFFCLSFDASPSLVAGTRVEIQFRNGSLTAAEVYSGGGYLSQSEEKLFFGYTKDNPPSQFSIRWSDGRIDEYAWNSKSKMVAKHSE